MTTPMKPTDLWSRWASDRAMSPREFWALLPRQAAWVRGYRPAVRCSAHRTDGEPCGNYAMKGCSVCHAHGGRAGQVRRAARLRLAEDATTVLAARALRRLGIRL